MALGGGLLASHIWQDHTLNFVRVPRAVNQKPIEWWTLPPFPFEIGHFAAHAPENLFVVAEINEGSVDFPMQALSTQRLIVRRYVDLHLLNLMDGSPHRAPPSNVIRWQFSMAAGVVSVRCLLITGSRLMMYVYRPETPDAGDQVGRILVWDWKTRDLVSMP